MGYWSGIEEDPQRGRGGVTANKNTTLMQHKVLFLLYLFPSVTLSLLSVGLCSPSGLPQVIDVKWVHIFLPKLSADPLAQMCVTKLYDMTFLSFLPLPLFARVRFLDAPSPEAQKEERKRCHRQSTKNGRGIRPGKDKKIAEQ